MDKKRPFRIDFYRKYSLEKLIELAATNYSSGSILNQNYLKWQYEDNPFGESLMSLAKDDESDELVGQYIVVPYHYVINGQIVKGSLSLNTLTREDFRGRGLFTKLSLNTYEKCAENGVFFTTGFPNQMSYPGFVKKLDFKYMGDVPLLIKPLRPLNILRNRIFKEQVKHGGELNIDTTTLSGFQELDFEMDKSIYNDFIHDYIQGKGVMLHKTFDYLKWRYADLPTRNYKALKLVVKNKIIAILIVKGERVLASKSIVIMDFMVLIGAEHKKVVKQSLKKVARNVKKQKFDSIAVLSNKNNYEYEVLKGTGFFKVPQKILPQPIPYIVRLNKSFDLEKEIFEMANWKIGFGDYDIF
jgi:hypothetical protein